MLRKKVASKKNIIFKKIGLKIRNPKFNLFSKITFIKLNSEEIKAILEQVNKISFRNSKLHKFLIKIYSELFLSSYLFISYLESSKKYFYSLNIAFNSTSLVESSICGVILPENVP